MKPISSRSRAGRVAAAAALALLFPAFPFASSAQSGDGFELSWSTIDGGGGSGTDGQFAASGTVGQPDPGSQSGNGFTVTGGFWNPSVVSGTPPTVSIAPVIPSLRNTPVTTMTVTFSEPVLGLDLSDFTLTVDGGANLLTGSESLFTTDSIVWEVGDLTDLTATTDGVYQFGLAASGSGVTDNFSNALANDDAVSWTLDATLPSGSVTLTDINPTSASQLNFSVTFSEDVSFTAGDLALSGTLAPLATPVVSGSGTSFTVSVSLADPDADGTLGIVVGTTVADPLGNTLGAPIDSDLYVLDNTGPLSFSPQDEGMVTTSPTVLFTWPASTDVHGISGYILNVGTTPGGSDVFSGPVGNVLSHAVTGVEDAVLYAHLNAVDTVGNVGLPSVPSDGILVDAVDVHAALPVLIGGNGDSIIDRNECHDVAIELTNVASTTLTSVSATLASATPGVTVTGNPAAYPDLAALESAAGTVPFVLQTAPDFRCGETIELVLTVTAAEGTFTESWTLETGRPGFARFDATAESAPIPDGTDLPSSSSGVLEVPLSVSGVTGELTGVTVSLHLQHPSSSDLVLELIAPDGTTALLAGGHGGAQQAYGTDCTSESERTTFDDQAALAIGDGGAPFVGPYRPQAPLLPLLLGKAGSEVNGVWKLRVSDTLANGETGTVECWSLGLSWKECQDGSCGGSPITPSTDLLVTKSAPEAPAYVDEPVTFTLVAVNRGADTATSVVLVDRLPAGSLLAGSESTQGSSSLVDGTLVCNAGSLAPDESVTVTVGLLFPAEGLFVNEVFVSGNEFDPDMANNTTSASVALTPRPYADLSVTKSADAPQIRNGEQVTWTMVVTNHGPDSATSVTLSDPLHGSLALVDVLPSQGDVTTSGNVVTVSLGSLAVGTSATVEVTAQASEFGQVLNSAFVSGGQDDPDTGNNTGSALVEILPAADLQVVQTASENPAQLAGPVTFTVTVTNSGPDTATSVTLTDTLPSEAGFTSATLSQGTYSVAGGVLTAEIGDLSPSGVATLTVSVTPQSTATLTNTATASADEADPLPSNNTSSVAVQVGIRFTPIHTDTFSTGSLDGGAGWVPFGFDIPEFASPEYDLASGAYRLNIAPDATRMRVTGVMSTDSELMPYSAVGADRFVRAKYYLYAGGQSRTIDIPAVRLRAAVRFAQTSLLEVFTHSSADPGATPVSTELAPSSDPNLPSLYRVDFDPIDVPSVTANPETEGIMRAFEAYTTDVSDQGYVAMTESVIGTYPTASLPLSIPPAYVYATGGDTAGNLSVSAGPGGFVTSHTLVASSSVPGDPMTEAGPQEGYCTYTENGLGVTFDTSNVTPDTIGVITREFDPGAEAGRVRVEEGKQYLVRFHVTSTVSSSDNAMINLRTRTAKFSYVQKLIIGGAHAASLVNNQIAAESLPGVGTQNPDKAPGDTTGGWYNVLMYSPLSPEIRPEFAADTPLSDRMPDFTAEPGPGQTGTSMRDLRVGADLVDTMSRGFRYQFERGNFTIDRIEIRVYDAIAD